MNTTTALDALRDAVGSQHVLTGESVDSRYLGDYMFRMTDGAPLAVVRPGSTEEVSAVVKVCAEHQMPVVPQGGLTGLTGAAVPAADGVALSLERLKGIQEVDAAASTMTVWAGTPLQVIQEAADEAGFLFPLDLGARGSCSIGGNISTNAGGNRVIRYGMTRDLVLGLEVVMADGTVVTSLNKMLKNNTGYDIRQMFIGAEGTLGVVTRAVLRLHPRPISNCAALCAVAGYDDVVALLRHVREGLAGTLSAFEMMWPDFYRVATEGLPATPPVPHGHGAYVLIEALGSDQDADQERFEAVLGAALEKALVEDVVVAQSGAETERLWHIRDATGELRRIFWPNVSFDVSLPTGDIGRFIDACSTALTKRWPEAETMYFGHVGDSNLHLLVRVGEGDQPHGELDEIVYELVRQWHGSVSAEHGIGLQKRPYLAHSRSPEELRVMRSLKQALDPKGIMNPGKIF